MGSLIEFALLVVGTESLAMTVVEIKASRGLLGGLEGQKKGLVVGSE